MNHHIHTVTMSGQRLINGVIHDLEHHVVETGTVIGIANVHARALTNCVETFKDFNTRRIVGVLCHLELSSIIVPCSTWNTLLATGCQTSVSFSFSMLVMKT